jgi:DtxR family transcriptional regulator, Mn-dependent transcriptional regulator
LLDTTHKRPRPVPVGESGEDYLESVYVLGREKRVVRVKDVAQRLGVSQPSVVAALGQLNRRGMVAHEPYGGIELTVSGRRVAEAVYRKHQVLQSFLSDVLGVSDAVAARDACRLEHALSPETEVRLARFVAAAARVSRGAETDSAARRSVRV